MAIELIDKTKVSKPEELLVLKQHRAKPVGELVAKSFKPGSKYTQSGLEKVEVIMRGLATTDLKAEVPKSNRRVAPEKGKEKYLNPYELLAQQNAKIIELLTELLKKK